MKRIEDKQIITLIRSYLNAGVLLDGLVRPTEEGVREAHCHRSSPTSCSTSSTGNLRGATFTSSATPTTATSTCGRCARDNE